MTNQSPLKISKLNTLGAQQSSAQQTKIKSPKKKKEKEEHDDIELEDATSVSLMNSFLIKNTGSTFENYSNQMKQNRRR